MKKWLLSWVSCFLIAGCFAKPVEWNRAKESSPFGWIAIDSEIRETTHTYVKFALEDFKKKNVSGVIVHLNTPGGEVFSSIRIANLLQQFHQEMGVPVIAYIDRWAVSAGAMIAYSCPTIITSPAAIMGAAEPVHIANGAMVSAEEKVNSALRSQFASYAKLYGRNPLIAKAMVDKDIDLVEKEGKVLEVSEETIDEKPFSRAGKLLTLEGDDIVRLGIADYAILPENDYMFLVKEHAKEWKLGDTALVSLAAFQGLEEKPVVTYTNWKCQFFNFLTHPAVSSLLILGLLTFAYLEITTPGFGVFGALAGFCLALLALSYFTIEAFHLLEMLLLGVGILLLVVELFVIPGFGVVGFLGIILMLGSLFVMMSPALGKIRYGVPVPSNMIWQQLSWLLSMAGFFLIGLFAFGRALGKKLFAISPLVLRETMTAAGETQDTFLGKEGEVETDLKPSGYIIVDGVRLQAISRGKYIKSGEMVEIISERGNTVIVRGKHARND